MKFPALKAIGMCLIISLLWCCGGEENVFQEEACRTLQVLDNSRGPCNVELPYSDQYMETEDGDERVIITNSIPDHRVGRFGAGVGSLNPNAISEQSETYHINLKPEALPFYTALLDEETGPAYSFGILLNGVELDPVAAEPFPHDGMLDPNVNWAWNLEALNVNLGLDCNNAHVQPSGKYHYHGSPILYLQNIDITDSKMYLIGYAADGFPIYYKYAFSVAEDSSSEVVLMTSSYRLKEGNRPGDGITAPCDAYNGIYTNDYEYIEGLGTLDQANGRVGVTPEYPEGTYYYIITDAFPSIPRFFRGLPSNDFSIGG